jgi:hypothetical protein
VGDDREGPSPGCFLARLGGLVDRGVAHLTSRQAQAPASNDAAL